MSRLRGGFTVIEAVVSLALGAVFLLLAAQLLRDTSLAALATRRQVLDPTPQHLAQRLRRDIQRSTGTLRLRGRSDPAWSRQPLTLMLPSGARVRYEKNADQVTRRLIDAAGASSGDRALLRGVVSWRWLELSPDLVEIEIGYRRQADGEALRRFTAVPRSSIDKLHLRVALRGATGRSSW